jgi:DNA-binding response OmpR family regulator/predicted regulator of Ras-like GTPase activity (Roadblock/LC7/MglB family)
MANQWHILVVEDEQNLNRNRIDFLRKDGYAVQGVANGAEAIRLLWTEKYDVVICDQKMPDVDGFEFLQWMRTYCPNTRMIMVASAGSSVTRTQALEGGVVSYLIKPVDMHVLKEELRRLLQQTGFSASLDSFDLLDLIQIISMSHKTIALVVNTGLEEQGILRFQNGELVWAEYGILRGEEAFFALAAHKNGTVIHQPWNKQITPNVSQPLSRLIFQALQYRAKYAAAQQLSGEQEAVSPAATLQDAIDDSPFLVLPDPHLAVDPVTPIMPLYVQEMENAPQSSASPPAAASEDKEWWQQSSQHRSLNKPRSIYLAADGSTASPPSTNGQQGDNSSLNTNISPSTVRRTQASQRTDLPTWLIEQPTQFDLPAMRLQPSAATGQVPAPPVQKSSRPSPAEWQPAPASAKTGEPVAPGQMTGSQPVPKAPTGPLVVRQNIHNTGNQPASPEWQPPEDGSANKLKPGQPLMSLSRKTDDLLSNAVYQEHVPVAVKGVALPLNGAVAVDRATMDEEVGASPLWGANGSASGPLRAAKRNYAALVAALQTLGYTVRGFIASAVVSLDGQPVAQVAVDDLDISLLCGYFSTIVQGALLSLDHSKWGQFEQTVITSATHHILLRIVGSEKEAFQVLITTHEANPVQSLEIMTNVEGAITAALR